MSTSVIISGIGLLSALGEGPVAHWDKLQHRGAQPVIETKRFAPYPVHPLGPVDFSSQISKKGDLRQMEPWQRIGTFAAGLALNDAGIAGKSDYLDKTDMIVAAGSGERDTATDMKVLANIADRDDGDIRANEILPSNLRPTLFLAQLSNLLAGNISIVHKVTGSSRTFMGEEMAGVSAVETAVRRIKMGQGELFLVGGAFNSEREDILLNFELGGMLLQGEFKSICERARNGASGFVPASVGAFLVLEEKSHAEARGAKIYAEIEDVQSTRCNRQEGTATDNVRALFTRIEPELSKGPLPVLSGASGVQPILNEELAFLNDLTERGYDPAIRFYGSVLGHGVEAQLPVGIALAAITIQQRRFFPPFDAGSEEHDFPGSPEQVLVTGLGHWRGEAIALVTRAGH